MEVSPTNFTKASTIDIHMKEGSDFTCVLKHAGENGGVFFNTSVLYKYYMEKKLDKVPFQNIHIPIKVIVLIDEVWR